MQNRYFGNNIRLIFDIDNNELIPDESFILLIDFFIKHLSTALFLRLFISFVWRIVAKSISVTNATYIIQCLLILTKYHIRKGKWVDSKQFVSNKTNIITER